MKTNVRSIVVAVLLAGCTTVVGTPAWAAAAQPGGLQMNPGDQLNPGGAPLTSPNGLNTLVMEPNGNLVEYIPGGVQVWSSGSSVPQSIFKAQGDGNFVVIAPGNQPQWDTGTLNPGDGRTNVLQIQDDRNVVVYGPDHVAIWSNHMAAGS